MAINRTMIMTCWLVSTVALTALVSSSARGQAVFPADPQVARAKQQQLDQIPPATTGDRRPPNVVLLLADDLGYADIGCYGSTTIPTPQIDALARTGARFSQAYVTAASCSPSRAGLLTGQYQQRFGFEFNTSGGRITHQTFRGLDPAAITLADVLQAAGYRTGMFGKWHLGTRPHLHPQRRGFDEFYGFLAGAHSFFPGSPDEPLFLTVMRDNVPLVEPEYLTDAIARETVDFIDRHHDKPFFAYVPFNAVHTPIEATAKYQARFPGERDPKQRDYNAMTSALDDAVGAIVAALERHQLTDHTIVIFTNDNGGPTYTGVQSNGQLKLGKLYLFEGGIRVPMIVRWPQVTRPNSQVDAVTSLLDLFPTLCAAAGIQLPAALAVDGIDLTAHLAGRTDKPVHSALYWSNGPNMAIRSGDWKLVKSHDSVWLYDLGNDPAETKNVASQHPQIRQRLEHEYERWQKEMAAPAWPSKPRRQKVQVDGQTYELNI